MSREEIAEMFLQTNTVSAEPSQFLTLQCNL